MTTLTLLQQTLTQLPICPPRCSRSDRFASSPRHDTAERIPHRYPSHSTAICCLRHSTTILQCRSPESPGGTPDRNGRVSRVGGGCYGGCDAPRYVGARAASNLSSSDENTPPTTTGVLAGEGAVDGDDLGDFSIVKRNAQGSVNFRANSLFPAKGFAKGFKPCMEGQGSEFIISSFDDSLHRPLDFERRPTSHQGRSSGDESLLSGSGSGLTKNEISSNILIQMSQDVQAGWFGKGAAVMKLAVVVSVLGFQACSQAWAGPEVAEMSPNSSFDLGDVFDIQNGFASAFLLIFFSEIGDKTFFIAALLATRRSSIAVFSGTFGALAIMTVISVFLGRIFHYIDAILPSFGGRKLPVDDIAAVILLVYFGVSTLLEAASMEDSKSGEEQQEAELAIAGVGAGGGAAVAGTVAATFALIFVAEWGDKSFFSTIALAASSSPVGVVTGAIAGHGAATLLAVLGGSFLGNFVSEKVIASIGGTLFLVFAAITLIEILN